MTLLISESPFDSERVPFLRLTEDAEPIDDQIAASPITAGQTRASPGRGGRVFSALEPFAARCSNETGP
jgi:hypothetical protein